MIERGRVDLNDDASRIVHLTRADDPLWSGAAVLAAGECISLVDAARHDLLVLEGGLTADPDGRELARGAFAIRHGSVHLRAGPQGAKLLMFRQASSADSEETTIAESDRPWREGRTPGMLTANLCSAGHALKLIMWQPGAEAPHHPHPGGEDIFVLRGELCEGDQRDGRGSWLRLHPGEWHSPHVEAPTLILVRSGHLKVRRQPKS